jgi:hypothetical protein
MKIESILKVGDVYFIKTSASRYSDGNETVYYDGVKVDTPRDFQVNDLSLISATREMIYTEQYVRGDEVMTVEAYDAMESALNLKDEDYEWPSLETEFEYRKATQGWTRKTEMKVVDVTLTLPTVIQHPVCPSPYMKPSAHVGGDPVLGLVSLDECKLVRETFATMQKDRELERHVNQKYQTVKCKPGQIALTSSTNYSSVVTSFTVHAYGGACGSITVDKFSGTYVEAQERMVEILKKLQSIFKRVDGCSQPASKVTMDDLIRTLESLENGAGRIAPMMKSRMAKSNHINAIKNMITDLKEQIA